MPVMGPSMSRGTAPRQPGGGTPETNPLSRFYGKPPEGYTYNTVTKQYERTPASAGGRVNEFMKAAGFGGSGGAGGGAGGGGTSFAGVGGVGGGGVAGGNIAAGLDIAPIDTTAADDAIFARAKDTAGQTGRASLESLRGLLGETGQLGGGAETQAVRDIVQSAAGQTGEVSRERAIQGSERGFQTALANQQTRLTQRGQDIAAQEAQARLALAQTQLQSQRSLELLRLALSQAATAGQALY